MTEGEKTRQTSIRELSGIVLLTFSVLIALALVSYQWEDISVLRAPPNHPPVNYIGLAGAWFSFFALMIFGVGAFLIPVGSTVIGILLLFKPKEAIRSRVIWGTVVIMTFSALVKLHPTGLVTLCNKLNISNMSGGIFGWLAAGRWLGRLMGNTGATILAGGVLIGSLFMFVGKQAVRTFFQRIVAYSLFMKVRTEETLDARRDKLEKIAREERKVAKQRVAVEKAIKKERRLARVTKAISRGWKRVPREAPALTGQEIPVEQGLDAEVATAPELFPQHEARDAKASAEPKKAASLAGTTLRKRLPYQLPPLDLLQPVPSVKDRRIQTDFSTTARILKETLAEFGIESEITNIEQGPVVTRYELLPAPGVRIEKISQLSNNLALTLKATSVRVQAPIPGKGVVGIEVPNITATRVYLREILEGEKWKSSKAVIPLILGKDVAGTDLVADLATMPHLLIAGATGSGKTVCLNSILAGLLMSRTPDQLRLMLIDPKIVEFAAYNHLPHLVVPVITDPRKVPLGLRWAINEMEKRYKLFARAGVRTIEAYNNRSEAESAPAAGTADDEEDQMPAHIPCIVIVIDELADLMNVAQSDIENSIARLAQLSRAVGIHMILATQRPSVNVITGTIKANFPARVSFQVAQKVDSRTILDTGGADKLLGRGDMLILPPGSSKLVRAQGAMTTDKDINVIVEFIKKQTEPSYEMDIKESIEGTSSSLTGDEDGQDDELIQMAIAIIRETHRASVSLLQRRLKIGYNRAGRLMDVLEGRGIVGPAHGSDPREILIDLNGEIE